MSRRGTTSKSGRSSDRSALIQWLALGAVVVLALIAALTIGGGSGGGGGHNGQPAEITT